MQTHNVVSRPFGRIRVVFAMLASLVFFATILIASAQIRNSYDSLIETEERAARNLVRSGESHATQIFKETQRILETVGVLYLDRHRSDDFDEVVFHDLQKTLVEGADYLYEAYLADEDGFALAAGNVFPLDAPSRTYSFMDIFDLPKDAQGFELGSFKRASERSGEVIGGRWFIPAILPIIDQDDDVRGYVIGLIDPTVFEDFYARLEVGQHGTVHLWAPSGTLVASNQNSPWKMGDVVDEIGQWMSEFADLTATDEMKIYRADKDDVPLVSTQLSVDNLNFALAVTLDGRDFLAPWLQTRTQIVGEAALFLLVVSILGYVLLRQLGKIEDSEIGIRDAKNEAERANRVKVQFLAQVSHEFRTPLNAIIGFSQAIRDRVMGPDLDHKYTEYADDIYESGRHLLDLVNDIIDFSKIEAGEYKVNLTQVSVNAVLEDVVNMMAVQARGRQVQLSPEFTTPDVQLEADPRLLKQVLINLIANAIKFSEIGASVSVRTQQSVGRVEIIVSDTGRGMSESILSRVGEPFLVESSQTNSEGQGTGLGLSIAKRCMDLMGGTLSLRSTEGAGTAASVGFPILAARV